MRSDELRTLFLKDKIDLNRSYRAQRAVYLSHLARALPDDPWHACDVMQLICAGRPRRGGQEIPCEHPARCADLSGMDTALASTRGAEPAPTACFWGARSSEAEEREVERYLAAWVEKNHIGARPEGDRPSP